MENAPRESASAEFSEDQSENYNESYQVDFFFNQNENCLYEMVECLRDETLN